MNHEINRLIHFALEHRLIDENDMDYAINLLLEVLCLDDFEYEEIDEHLETATPILENVLAYAIQEHLIEDSITAKDLFDTKIMNCLMPRPSEVIKQFEQLYQKSPQEATNYYYHLSIASNYIRKARTDQNIGFKRFYRYGEMEITINLSKPEKDPKEIAKAKLVKTSGYPKCLLCKENVGFAGDYNRQARHTHRIIPLCLDGDDYFLQYSPYVYYNEHCIVFNKIHQPMQIHRATFQHLLSFVEKFPHYMLGSNADLPIVGGSILTHDHFQGGSYTFPLEKAKVIKTLALKRYPDLKIEILYWPLATIRITSSHQQAIVNFSDDLLQAWKQYSNEALDIISHSGNIPHNTITPIARMKQGIYQMNLVLRNNRTNQQYPDGIFHPHPHLHHIKKENIGLIEVMGLAILPARLKEELKCLRECLLHQQSLQAYPCLEKHRDWYCELERGHTITQENVDEILAEGLTQKFVEVLENAGVFKMDQTGIEALVSFVQSLDREG